MEPFILHKKTGFRNKTPKNPVIIRDFRGKLFYSTEGLKPVHFFNLPEGSYLKDAGSIVMLNKPVKKTFIKLPPPERNFKAPLNFNVVFGVNPNKCTIQWDKKRIIYDNSLKNATIPTLYFILFHEFAHALYTNEAFADICAANYMLQKGFNESQIGIAPINTLSHFQYKRKKFLISKLLKK